MDAATVAIYDRSAREWGERRGPELETRAEDFRELVGGGLIADLGCGVGRHLGALGMPVVGLDASFGMLQQAAGAAAPLVHGDIGEIPFRTGSVAGIFARRSYLHVPKAQTLEALRDAYRVLAPGGVIAILLIGGSYEGHELRGDDFPGRFYACWQTEEFVPVVEVAGFTEIVTEDRPFSGELFDLWVTARKP